MNKRTFFYISLILLALQGFLYIAFSFINSSLLELTAFNVSIILGVNFDIENSFSNIISLLIYFMFVYGPIIGGLELSILALFIWRRSERAYNRALEDLLFLIIAGIVGYIIFYWMRGQVIYSEQRAILDTFVLLLAVLSLPYSSIFLNQLPVWELPRGYLYTAALYGLGILLIYNFILLIMLKFSKPEERKNKWDRI